jgi:N-ethylmaleimide reductase
MVEFELGQLFTGFDLHGLALPNRVVMAPMTRRRAADGKVPTQLVAQHYEQRASAGLIISESIEVDPSSGLAAPTRPGLFADAQQAGWKEVTGAVHAAGGRIFAQLSHMGRAAHSSQLAPGGRVVAPSAIAAEGTVFTASGPKAYELPHELTASEIKTIVGQYDEAARRARLADFDGIELHGANGYLIDQFLRDASNQRSDAYGGDATRRARFLLEVLEAVTAHWPSNHVGIRFSPTNNFQGMADSDPVHHYETFARLLAPLRTAYLHVVEPAIQPDGLPYVAPAIRGAFDGALILAGKYDRDTAETAVSEGRADLVAFGEKYIANPDLPERLRHNRPLAAADKATYYTPGPAGYVDYPAAG